MLNSGKWDIRVPKQAIQMIDRSKPYYWMFTKEQTEELLGYLSKAYMILVPKVVVDSSYLKKEGSNAQYWGGANKIILYHRHHIKSAVHEFYHHLDEMTGGMYDSSDNEGGETSLAWQFANKWFDAFRGMSK